jgi:hypothetical protein
MATFGRRGLVTALGLGVALLGAMRLPGAQAANVTVSPDDASVSYIGSWTDQVCTYHLSVCSRFPKQIAEQWSTQVCRTAGSVHDSPVYRCVSSAIRVGDCI